MIAGQTVVVSLVGGPEVKGALRTLDLTQVVLTREHPVSAEEADIKFDLGLVDGIRFDAKVDVENVPALVQGNLARKAATVPVKTKAKK